MKHTEKQNLLYKEKSPYLLQHKDNPVHWQPWGAEALALAKAEDKPIFLSIGYSTCYWCHVMEKDSFETEEIAKILNKDFISIKVDREERPDVDSLYMNAVVAMSGHGGWPMSVFLTPDGLPFFGGTFFWKAQFTALLNRITELWQAERKQIQDSAESLGQHLKRLETPFPAHEISAQHLKQSILDYQKNFDAEWGGFGHAPKFPPHMSLRFLLRMYHSYENQTALQIAERTLEMMARGGIYDHIGGGFSRYSTDVEWRVPHFEKMLYDNAQLAETYLEAYQLSRRSSFLDVVTETLNYVLREMTSPQGGFYSAQDAGPVGREGEFYLWKKPELEQILNNEDLARFCEVFGVTDTGNFEQRNVLHLAAGIPWEAREESAMLKVRAKLFEQRGRRVAPLLDDKILTDWNALMIVAFAKSYRVTADKRYLVAAQEAASFIKKNLYISGTLLHRYRDGEAKINGFLTDYAYLIHALFELYQTDFNENWLDWAKDLQDKQDLLFWDKEQAGYYSSEENAELFSRSKEFNDSVTPSGNSVSYLNLLRFANLNPLAHYKTQAEKLLHRISGVLVEHPSAFPFMLSAIHYQQQNMQSLVIASSKNFAAELNKNFHTLSKNFYPQLFLAQSNPASNFLLLQDKVVKNDQLTFYLCSAFGCSEPINDFEEILQKLIISAAP